MKNFSFSFFLKKMLYPSVILLIVMTVLTGMAYPLLITGIAQSVFPDQANGSLIWKNGRPVGSRLIGQHFSENKYFWSRPSATSPYSYNAAASSGSNLGPTNPTLTDQVKDRIARLKVADPENPLPIPVDLVTSSASGLDPHISKAAADYQIGRIARVRNLPKEKLQELVKKYATYPRFGFLGEPKVNVLELNLALDEIERSRILEKGA